MRTTPSRRTTLQFLQICFTEALTFIFFSFQSLFARSPGLTDPVRLRLSALAHPVCDSASREVIWRQFYRDLVAGQDFYVVHPHLARNMGQHLVPVVER